ncbi:proteasome accessory factor A [Arcanobacterium wilhelmae]|uniref:Pup--protein ligase n=1 Tax=Arcanobacterium wilhelmae TaxID=1803177 RepID=A0ABT9N8E2_9ACTO|nr:Pup--protein ligase [Arcanobacterium wilhelmae]MDP9799974.1 proteasome accessory factor A [Arcanobacterium wilhelmae]WFN91107.1 Pup--protein ligase [Arcanobacterium wilhelmae]
MNRRIIGIETEYGITAAALNSSAAPVEAEQAAELLFQPVVETNGSTNAFLTNGARLYLDIGAHPEYATAECDSVRDLLLNERAGDLMLRDLARTANAKLEQAGVPSRIHLMKNNLDSAGNSFGCHENYLVRRRPDFTERVAWLIPFFTTRQILVGSGHIRRSEAGTSYELSQRADQVWDSISNASTRSRPMINTRDEPHADVDQYRRMHVIVGDTNMLEPTMVLKVAATEALLNVVESGVRLPRLELVDPPAALRTISRDLTGTAPVPVTDGTAMSALDIQTQVHDFVLGHYEKEGWLTGLDPIRAYGLDLWTRGLDALRAGTIDTLANELDWVAKKRLLERYCDRLGTDLSDVRIARLALAWHDITDAGLLSKLEDAGAVSTLVPRSDVESAQTLAPQTTRAALRGRFIEEALRRRRGFTADWTTLRLADAGQTVALKDPFASVDPRVDELIGEMS